MVKVRLTSSDGESCLVYFDGCESLEDVAVPIFQNLDFRFPYDAIENQYGHIPKSDICSVEDFIYKAPFFNLIAEVVEQ